MNLQSTVGQLVVERPARSRVFERFGIDYCCGGKKPLPAACQEMGLAIDQVVAALEAQDSAGTPEPTRDWSAEPLAALADHIQETHHAWLKEELPRLDRITDRVATVHGRKHPELIELRAAFVAFKAELDMHMQKEERILFPLCRALEAGEGAQDFHCGSIQNPIAVMMREHDDAGEALAKFRALTGGYVPPQGACNTYRAMLAGLADLEADMHQHVHKENNILFPHAVALEQKAAAKTR